MGGPGGSADRSGHCRGLPTDRRHGRGAHSDVRADRCSFGRVVPAVSRSGGFPAVGERQYALVVLPGQAHAREYAAVAEAGALLVDFPLQGELALSSFAEQVRRLRRPGWQ